MKSIYFKAFFVAMLFLSIGNNSLHASCIFADQVEIKELPIGNLLVWATIEEQNNQYFAIQRSYDGIEFETIGKVEGSGNSFQKKDYQFLDTSIGNDRVFYKIKQIDMEGYGGLSHTIVLHRTISNNFVVSSMSQTMTDRIFTMTVASSIKGMGTYQVLDMNRKVQQNKEFYFVDGKNTISVNLEGLKNGKYYFALQLEDEVEELLIRKVAPEAVPTLNYVIKEK